MLLLFWSWYKKIGNKVITLTVLYSLSSLVRSAHSAWKLAIPKSAAYLDGHDSSSIEAAQNARPYPHLNDSHPHVYFWTAFVHFNYTLQAFLCCDTSVNFVFITLLIRARVYALCTVLTYLYHWNLMDAQVKQSPVNYSKQAFQFCNYHSGIYISAYIQNKTHDFFVAFFCRVTILVPFHPPP